MLQRKGIILAGGFGTRLYPLTISVSKQLLPIYDKPMIYYPLTTLMLAGIRDILIITNPQDQNLFKTLLGNGNQWGINLSYVIQKNPDGLAHAFILGEKFLNGSPSTLILGDNIFFGGSLSDLLKKTYVQTSGATIFCYHVSNPESYGVVDYDHNGNVQRIIEKPKKPPSNYAITGLYFLDHTAPERAKQLKPSSRGELEITSLLESYMNDNSLKIEKMESGYAWLDTGTHESLLEAGIFVNTLSRRQGLKIGSPDDVAYNLKWITKQRS